MTAFNFAAACGAGSCGNIFTPVQSNSCPVRTNYTFSRAMFLQCKDGAGAAIDWSDIDPNNATPTQIATALAAHITAGDVVIVRNIDVEPFADQAFTDFPRGAGLVGKIPSNRDVKFMTVIDGYNTTTTVPALGTPQMSLTSIEKVLECGNFIGLLLMNTDGEIFGVQLPKAAQCLDAAQFSVPTVSVNSKGGGAANSRYKELHVTTSFVQGFSLYDSIVKPDPATYPIIFA